MKLVCNTALITCLVLIIFIPKQSASQFVNNGGTISLTDSVIVYAKMSFTNNDSAKLINNGNFSTDSTIINNSAASLSGDGVYSIQGNFTNNGSFSAGNSILQFTGNGTSTIKNKNGIIYKLQLSKNQNGIVDMLDKEQVSKTVAFLNDNNYIRLNKYTFTLAQNAAVSGFSDKRYFITNDTGSLKKLKVGTTPFLFPVGYNNTTYNPLSVTENGNADDYYVRCLDKALANGSSGSAITTNGINVSWLVSQAVAGGNNATIKAQWKSADELSGFNSAKCMVVRYNGSKWDFSSGNAIAASGSPYKSVSRSGLSSLGYFTVLSGTPSSSLQSVISDALIANKEIKIYPTIVKNDFNIAVPFNNKSIQKMNILVMSDAGKIVWQKQNADFESQKVLLPQLASGMYVVLIQYDNEKFIQKIIVSH